jgi:hypothetical protein
MRKVNIINKNIRFNNNMKAIIYIFIALSVASMISCNKNDEELENNPIIPVDTLYDIPESIFIGDLKNMYVVILDTILLEYNYRITKFYIDLNDDGDPDISFSQQLVGSAATGKRPKISIETTHDSISISGYLKSDTSFLNYVIVRDTLENNHFYTKYISTYSCERISPEDSIVNITQNSVIFDNLKVSTELNKNDEFVFGTFVFNDQNYQLPPTFITEDNHKKLFKLFVIDNCNILPIDSILYIGFKLIEKDRTRLGWIKFKRNNAYKVYMIESAIQFATL